MSSILTNNGAMTALQTLKSINSSMAKTQNEISTGKSVSNAKDNAAIWSISKTMESDVQGFKAISDSLSIGESTVAVARNAAETTTDLLKDIKQKIVAAQDGTVNRETLQQDIKALTDQIGSVVGAAQFNGVNLVNDSASGLLDDDGSTTIDVDGDGTADKGIRVVSSLDRDASGAVATSRINVKAQNLNTDALTGKSADGTTDIVLDDIDVTTTAGAVNALNAIEDMIKQATDAGAAFGSVEGRITTQNDFVGKLTDSLKSGIGSMVDADMEEVSARLQALQTQQQLGVQSLSIANQAPQSILSLFR